MLSTPKTKDKEEYFTANIAPEWKASYRNTGPIDNNVEHQNVNKNASYLPWILVIIILIPLCYFVYDSIERKLDDANLLSEVERKLLIIEEQINSIQNTLDLYTPLGGKLNDIQVEVSNMKTRLPDAVSLKRISQQITNQNQEIENINQKITYINDGVLKSSQNYQEEEQRYHTVQKGNNLFQISAKNGITIQQLKEINGIGPNEGIFPGQKLKLE